MPITPIHHIPLKPEYRSPFSAAFAVEDARLLLFSGCGPIPIYHAHPHDPVAEAEWLAGGIREQTEKTFANIGTILEAAGADFSQIVKLNIYLTDMSGQDVLNEISERSAGRSNRDVLRLYDTIARSREPVREPEARRFPRFSVRPGRRAS